MKYDRENVYRAREHEECSAEDRDDDRDGNVERPEEDGNAAQEEEERTKAALKDSVDARLIAWKSGKETNIRALVSSLENVLWPELEWQKVGLHELVSPGQVKVRYMKAIAKLHPDKACCILKCFPIGC